MKSRIMYIENKTTLAGGEAHIGRVTFSKTAIRYTTEAIGTVELKATSTTILKPTLASLTGFRAAEKMVAIGSTGRGFPF